MARKEPVSRAKPARQRPPAAAIEPEPAQGANKKAGAAEPTAAESEARIYRTGQAGREDAVGPQQFPQAIVPVGTWEIEIPQGKLTWSKELYPLFGISPGEFGGTFEAFLALVHPDDREHIREACAPERLKAGGEMLNLEYRICRPDGLIKVIFDQGRIRFDKKHNPVYASGAVIEITGLKALEESHRALFDQSAVGMGTISEDSRFIETNRRFQEIVGYTGDELRGTYCSAITHPDDRAMEAREEARLVRGETQSVSWDKRYVRKDGRIVWANLTLSRLAIGRGTPVLSGVVLDITARKESELELAQSRRSLQMLSRCNEALIRAESESTLLDEICEIAVSVGGYRMAAVAYAQDDAQKSITPMSSAGWDDGYWSSITISWDADRPEGRGSSGRTIRTGQPVIVPDLLRDPDYRPWHEAALARGYRSVVALPLVAGGRAFGVFGLYGAEARAVSQDEVKLLRELADDLAFGIMGLRARQEQRRLLNSITTIAEGVSISTGADFYQRLLLSLTSVLGAHAAVITDNPGRSGTVHAVCAVVNDRVIPDFAYELRGSPCEVLLEKDSLVVPRGARERYPNAVNLRQLEIEAYVGRSLYDSRGRPIGMIYVLFQTPLVEIELANATLKTFASRAAGEMVRQQDDSQLREQALLLDAAHDAILVRTLDHRIAYWNKGAERLYGWSAGEIRGKYVKDYKVADLEMFDHAMEMLLRDGEWTGEITERTKSGRSIAVECHWTLVRDAAGHPKSVLSIATDVTERRRAAAHLRLLEASLARLNDFVLITEGSPLEEPGPRIVYVNDAFVHRTGYERDEVLGRSPRFLQGPETSSEQLDVIRDAMRKGEAVRVELINYTKSGEPFWIEIDIVPMFDRTGAVAHFVAVERDITERKRAAAQLKESEARLAHIQRLESIGELTGGIAHDFNNLLTVILGNAEMLADATRDNARLNGIATMVETAGKRGAALTSKLLAFSRRQPLEPEAVRAGQVIEGMLPLLQRALGENIRVDAQHADDSWTVFVDPTQLESAILNLCINARDAMPEGGHLLIESSDVILDAHYARENAELLPGEYVMVAITDTGTGIAREHLEHVVEPFFTTKPKGKGTGLGLSMVYGFMKQSGGHLKIYSELGAGTSVKLYLPRSARELAAAAMPSDSAEDLQGSGTILLVEDDEMVRSYAEGLLRQLGYEVIAVAGGQDALNVVESGAGFDLLFTDVMMPGGMNGPQLAARVRRLRPDIPVLYTSGYTENAIVQQGRLDAEANLLHKPYTRRRLSEKLRHALKAASSGERAGV